MNLPLFFPVESLAPVITTNPEDVVIDKIGDNASFTWAGSTGATHAYLVADGIYYVQDPNVHTYLYSAKSMNEVIQVVLTNDYGSAYSHTANLTVRPSNVSTLPFTITNVDTLEVTNDGSTIYATYRNTAASTIYKISNESTMSVFATDMQYPFGMSVDTNNNLYVAARPSPWIYKFTPAGVKTSISTTGLNIPYSIAVIQPY